MRAADPNISIALGMYKELKPYDKKLPTYEERMGLPPTAKQIKEAALEPKGRKKKLTPDEKLAKKKDAKLRKGRRKELNKVETKIRKREKKGMGMEDRRAPVGKNIKNIRTAYSQVEKKGRDNFVFVEKFIKLAVEKYPNDKESAIRMLMNTSKGRDLTIPLLKNVLAEMGGISYPAYEKIWRQSKIPALELNRRTGFTSYRWRTDESVVRTDRYDTDTIFTANARRRRWVGDSERGKKEVYDYEGGRYFTTNAGKIIYPETNEAFDWGVGKFLSPFNTRREIWTGGVPVWQEGNYSVEPDEDTAMLPEIKPDTILKSFTSPKKILLEMLIDIYIFYSPSTYDYLQQQITYPLIATAKLSQSKSILSPVVVPIGKELAKLKEQQRLRRYVRDRNSAYTFMKEYFSNTRFSRSGVGSPGEMRERTAEYEWKKKRGEGKAVEIGFARPKPPNDMPKNYQFTNEQVVARPQPARQISKYVAVPEKRAKLSYYYNAGHKVWLIKNNTGNIFAAFTRNKSYIQQRNKEVDYARTYRQVGYTFGKSIEDQLKEDMSPLNANLQKYLNTNIQDTTKGNVRHF